MLNILILCTGNSARSIVLEAILNRDSGGRIRAFSAGSKPAGKVHPQSLKLLSAKGFDTSNARSKSWNEFTGADAPAMDAVITVCGSAAAESCPFWPGAPVRAHWGVDDPAAAAEPNWPVAFEAAFNHLSFHASGLFTLPFETFDRAGLQAALTQTGATHADK